MLKQISSKHFFVITLLGMLLSLTFPSIASEPNYEELLNDSSYPITLGIGGNVGGGRSNYSIIPSPNFDDPAIANSFAFKVDGKGRKAMPWMLQYGLDIYLTTILFNRSIWKIFYSYPILGIDFIYRTYNSNSANLSGSFLGCGFNVGFQGDYLSNSAFVPKLGFAIGLYKAPIGSKSKKRGADPLSHPNEDARIKPKINDNAKPLFQYNSLGYLFRGGLAYRYKVSRRFNVSGDMMLEYLLLGGSNGKVVTIDKDTRSIPTKKRKPRSDFSPKKPKTTSLVSLVLGANVECTFNPAKRKFIRYDRDRNRNSGEVGIFIPFRKFNKMTHLDHVLYEKTGDLKKGNKSKPPATQNQNNTNKKKKEKKKESSKIDFDDNFIAVGIHGLYSFRITDKFAFLATSELVVYDQIVKKKIKIAGLAAQNSSKLSIAIGFGADYNIFNIRSFLGYDLFSMDYLGDVPLYAIAGRLFIKFGGQVLFHKNIAVGACVKARPLQSYLKDQIPSFFSDGFEISLSYVF